MTRKTTITLAAILPLLGSRCVYGIATQEEMFKSINSSVSEPVDPTRFIAGLIMVVAVIVVAAVITNRLKKKPTRALSVNNGGRLLKEMIITLRLRPAQVRQLKALAAERGVDSPLTLVLCPSLRTAGAQRVGES